MTIDVRERLEGTVERRTFDANLETRDLGDGATGFHLTGYATVFSTPYNVGGENGFIEVISPGALKRSLAENPDVQLLQNHEGMPLARTKSGTLTLVADAHGLKVDADLDPTDPDVQALAPKLRRGDVDSMSISFRATGQKWSADRTERTITAMSVHRGDVSVVARPASESTSVALRHAGEGKKAPPVRSYVEQARAARAKLRRGRVDAKPTPTSAARSRTGAGRYSVERAKAAKAKARRAHPGSDAHVAGHDNAPRYTEAQVEALGKRGLAHKRNPGAKPEYNFPILDRRDLLDAIAAFGVALPSEKASVRVFIKTRARLLRFESLLPESWQSKAIPKLHPKEEQ